MLTHTAYQTIMYVNTKLRPIIYFFIDQVAIAYCCNSAMRTLPGFLLVAVLLTKFFCTSFIMSRDTYLLYLFIVLIYCTYLLYLFIVLIYCTYLLYLFIVLIYCTYLLYLFIVLIYCTYLLYLFTVLIYCTIYLFLPKL